MSAEFRMNGRMNAAQAYFIRTVFCCIHEDHEFRRGEDHRVFRQQLMKRFHSHTRNPVVTDESGHHRPRAIVPAELIAVTDDERADSGRPGIPADGFMCA